MPSDDPYRLPRHVLPRRYDLELVVDPERSGFSGRVRIEVEVIEATDRITLNSLDLDLTVEQNLAYHAGLHGLTGGRRFAAIEKALAKELSATEERAVRKWLAAVAVTCTANGKG